MWRTIAVVLGAAVLVGAGAATVSALAAPAGGGTVYIATGENFPDAVTAGAAAGAGEGPVLLVRQNSIPTPTLTELNRLKPFLIVIVGGTGVVSTGVEDQLKALSFSPIVLRKGGLDRYETAALLSQDTFPKIGAASCPGYGFFPSTDGFPYSSTSNARFYPDPSTVTFWCEISLTHGATVTRLSAGIDDTASFDSACSLRRVNITGNMFGVGIGNTETMATTSFTSGNSGPVKVTTTDISGAVVDNTRYGYWVNCNTGPDFKITGATVEYELSS